MQKTLFFINLSADFVKKFNLTDEFSVNIVIPCILFENNMHTVIPGQKSDNKVTCSAANLFSHLTASKSMETNK